MKLIFYICMFMFCGIAHAADITNATYMARGAGMHLMGADMDLIMDANRFKMITRSKTKGLLSVLLDAKTVFLSEGKVEDNQFIDEFSSMTSLSKKKTKRRVVDLKNKPGFVDYQTAVLSMMHLPKPQSKAFHVFDAKRELLISFHYEGEKNLPKNDYSFFAGQADYYTVTIEITAGKKKGWFFNRMDDKSSPPLRAYFAPLGDNGEKILVRGEFDTSVLGTITVYLTDLKQGKSDAIKH